jgi:hypothetical protein
LGKSNSNPFCIDQIDLKSKTTHFSTQVWAIALITADPPDFFKIHFICIRFSTVSLSPVRFVFSNLSISIDVITLSSSCRYQSLNLRCRRGFAGAAARGGCARSRRVPGMMLRWQPSPCSMISRKQESAGREGARFVMSPNACRFAAFSSERPTLLAPMLPNSMSRVHSSLGS